MWYVNIIVQEYPDRWIDSCSTVFRRVQSSIKQDGSESECIINPGRIRLTQHPLL